MFLALSLTFLCGFGAFLGLAAADLSSRGYGFRQDISNDLYADLEELARLTAISYCVGNAGIQKPFSCLSHCKDFPNYELVTTFGDGLLDSGTSGYIAIANAPSKPRVFVAFRGTYSIPDTTHDILAAPATYHPFWVTNGTCAEADCQTHLGYATAWNISRPAVLETLKDLASTHPEHIRHVELLGHSMGGAVAGLAALEMKMYGLPQRANIRVTTFGEPRFANAPFTQYIDEVFPWDVDEAELAYRRVTHRDDPVPLLPWEEFGWKMHGGEIFIDSSELPPLQKDIRRCLGPQDPTCIEGSDEEAWGAAREKDKATKRDAFYRAKELALEDELLRESGLLPKLPRSWHIWQLLFAHREYFWKMGLCLDVDLLKVPVPEGLAQWPVTRPGSLEL